MQPSDPQGQPPAGENQPPTYGQASSPGYGAQGGYPYSSPPSPSYGSSPPSGYGTTPPPGYGYPSPPRRTNAMAIAAMVVSLASLVTCPIVGVVGIYLGNRARNEIRSTGDEGDGMALAGIIVGWIAIALTVLYVCLFAGMFTLPFILDPGGF
jgi:hypothetical protein